MYPPCSIPRRPKDVLGRSIRGPPIIFWCPRGICPRHAMTNNAKLWFHASLRCLYPFDMRFRRIQPHAQFKIVILIPQLQLDLPSSLFPSDFLGNILSYMYSFSVSCVPHSSLTSSPIIYGTEYVQAVKLLITRIFPRLLLLPPLLVANWFPRDAFSNTPLSIRLLTFHNRTKQAK